MDSKKFLMCIVALFVSIIQVVPAVKAYQELHEPNVVYIEYMSKEGTHKAIGMYESVANTLMKNVGGGCFEEIDDPESSAKKYLLLGTKNCNGENGLFSKILEFYEEALNASPDETVTDMAIKAGIVKVMIKHKETLRSLYVKVNKAKRIITTLIM
jgi:hypothetical protein